MSASLPLPVAASAFEYIGGNPALDFVNTADWTVAGATNERLTGYNDLVRWSVEAGILSRSHGDRLRRASLKRTARAGAALADAHRMRDILREVFASVATGRRPARLKELNPLVAEAMGRLELSDTLHWQWRGAGERLDAMLWPVVRAAAELLTSDEAGQIRVCGGSDCGWMFVDRSRNGLRRWCQMRTCGTREKTRRRRT
jgi:predicted RNA-binding Zn ribbon-like protein